MYAILEKMESLRIIELFAGVGGFRVGFERADKDFFKTIWSNQWEPATKTQHASRTYVRVFGEENHVNEDIAKVKTSDIPNHDILVGGFPCQDYSVARTLSQSEGIVGKKGVLWWQIHRIVQEKGDDAPQILFLENVDRLLISPASQRGRDFAIILQSLADLDYIVEWRIINAAEYGMPQRRKRTYILAYKKGSPIADTIKDATKWLFEDGVFAKAFPVHPYNQTAPLSGMSIKADGTKDLADISSEFNANNKNRYFENTGIMIDGSFYTYKTEPNYTGPYTTLGDVLVKGEDRKYLSDVFYISDEAFPRWEYLKGAKREVKKNRAGQEFIYAEGGMAFPDALDKASRTIITSEGGTSPSRFSHVVRDSVDGRLRRLLPIELERLNMFPDNHTEGESDIKRAFFMGNALVCGIITAVGNELKDRLR